jgi:hypothetical protein
MAAAAFGRGSAHFHCGWFPTGRVKLVRTSRPTPRRRRSDARPGGWRPGNRRRRSVPGPGGRDRRVLRRTGSTFVRGCGRSHVTVRRGTAIGLLHASSRSLRARGQRRGQCDRETRGQTPTFFGGPARKALCYGFCFHTASPLFSTPTIHECGENREVKSVGWVSVCRADKRCAEGVGPGGFEPPLTDPKAAPLAAGG